LSSTTDRRRQRGQAIVIFAGGVIVLAMVGALAFDVGMVMHERRDEQNTADAAALAGARCLSLPPRPCDPVARAREVATLNGFTQGTQSTTVTVVATSSQIQVRIARTRPGIFSGVMGLLGWNVQAVAVAVNLTDQPPFASLVALNPTACPAMLVSGSGVINTYGDVQVNSSCPTEALKISGQGNLDFRLDGLGCYVVGGSQVSGKARGSLCDPPQPGVPLVWPVNAMPSNTASPLPPELVADNRSNKNKPIEIPGGCPGGGTVVSPSPSPSPSISPSPSPSPSPTPTPTSCQFQASYDGTVWRLFPGYYPGGIKLQAGTFYLEPGIYHLGGGGFVANSTGVGVTSVDPGGTTLGGGVLLFNTTHPTLANGPIDMGGSNNTLQLWPLGGLDPNCAGPSTGWNRYLIFQDPAVTNTLSINGGSNNTEARGLIFAPGAQVKINGGSGTLTIDAVIADTFVVNGNGGTINVLYDKCALPTFTGYGLVI
jgi:Flp pilus assembly protein TadG